MEFLLPMLPSNGPVLSTRDRLISMAQGKSTSERFEDRKQKARRSQYGTRTILNYVFAASVASVGSASPYVSVLLAEIRRDGTEAHLRIGPLEKAAFLLSCALTVTLVLLPSAFLLFAFLPKAQDTPAENWSQFRGNHQLTGVSLSAVPNSLKQLWTYEAGDSIESSAAIVGGTVFVGSQKGELVALNLDNGQVYWKFSTGFADRRIVAGLQQWCGLHRRSGRLAECAQCDERPKAVGLQN